MLAHLPRLLVLWRIIAGYRLDTLIPADAPVPLGVRLVLLLVRLHPAWWSATPMLGTYDDGEHQVGGCVADAFRAVTGEPAPR